MLKLRGATVAAVLIGMIMLAWVETGATQPSPAPSPTPSGTATATPSPSGSATPSSTPAATPSQSPTPSGSQPPTTSPTPEPTPTEADGIVIEAQTSRILAGLGDVIEFRIIARNPTAQTLTGVVILDEVPGEIEVVGIPFTDGIEAYQIGEFRGRQDIVWVLEDIEPGGSIEVSWLGQATSKGDLEAHNKISAKTGTLDMAPKGTTTTYLGAADGLGIDNPPFKGTEKREVTFQVAVDPVTGAQIGPPGSLPLTGPTHLGLGLGAAAVAIASGLALLLLARAGRKGRLGPSLVVLVLLVTACVSSEDPQNPVSDGEPPTKSEIAAGNSDEPSKRDGASVKGIRFGVDDVEPPGSPGDPDGTGVAALDASPAPIIETVTEIQTVAIGSEDLSSTTLGEAPVDNHLTFEWDEPSRTIGKVASSRSISSDQSFELLTNLSPEGDTVSSRITIGNLSEDIRLAVRGRLVLVIEQVGGFTTKLESDPIDVILDPGGSTEAEFDFLLPTGSYSLGGYFAPSSN